MISSRVHYFRLINGYGNPFRVRNSAPTGLEPIEEMLKNTRENT